MIRLRQSALLIRPLARTVRWLPLPAAALVGVGLLTFAEQGLVDLRTAMIALSIGAAFVLDDPAADTVESSPAPLLFRATLRIALVLPLVAALWGLLLWAASGSPAVGASTLELAGMLAVTFAAAALLNAAAAGPVLLVVLGAARLLPDRWSIFDGSRAAHERWAMLLAIALAGFFYASLDPGRLRLSARMRRHLRPLPSAAAEAGPQPG